jgi:hypothetical protein
MQNNAQKHNRSGGFVWPIVLILAGMVFLLKNLGLIDTLTWNSIWRLWPLFIVVIGLDGLIRRKEIVGPVIMFGLGASILLSNFGWGWNSWSTILRFWPILVVALGLEIMIGRRSPWLSAVGVLIVALIFVGLLWFSGFALEPRFGQAMTEEIIHQELGAARNADLDIAQSVGELYLDALDYSDALIAGEVSVEGWQEVRSEYKLQGDTAFYFLRSQFPGSVRGNSWSWNLGLTTAVPLELDVSMGAGEMNLDLDSIMVTSLGASQGVGELSIILPKDISLKGDISQAIGQIVIYVPESVAVRLEVSKAISSLDVPGNFDQRGEYYTSPGYDSADQRIDLDISQAIGSIEIRFEK